MIVPTALANVFCLIVGYLYPAYASFKTLEAKYDEEQYRRWLVYWVVISAFSAVELFGDNLLFWFPFYYECKMGFIAWLVLPYFKGSATIYHQYIEPALEKYYPQVDAHVAKLHGVVQNAIGKARNESVAFVKSHADRIVSNIGKSNGSEGQSNETTDKAADKNE